MGPAGAEQKEYADQSEASDSGGASIPVRYRRSVDFFGSRHFSKTNEYLKANGLEPIDWQIENI